MYKLLQKRTWAWWQPSDTTDIRKETSFKCHLLVNIIGDLIFSYAAMYLAYRTMYILVDRYLANTTN